LPLLLGPAQAVPELLDAGADPLPVQLFTERSGSCWAAVNTPMTADRVRGAMSVPMTPALYSACPGVREHMGQLRIVTRAHRGYLCGHWIKPS
jgi:hypothetical protein